MTNEQRMKFLLHVVALIFQSKAMNTNIKQVRISPQWAPFIAQGGEGRWFKNNLRGFDLALRLGNQIKSLRFVEQNPMKLDASGNLKQYALLAQQGHQICWVIDQTIQPNTFLGRVQDGQFFKSEPRATYSQPMQYNAGAQTYTPQNQASVTNMNDLPEMPVDMGIPEYVITSMSDPEVDPAVLADLETDTMTEDSFYDDLSFDPNMG